MGLEMIQAIQQLSGPVWDVVFVVITMFGEQLMLAGVFFAVYWCADKKMGQYLIYALCASLCLNGIVKDIFQVARPIGREGVVSKWVDTATGHSFPSAHSQSAATFWWGMALWQNKRWFKLLAALLIFAVGFSRLYLGVHYPTDVLGGIALGILVAALFHLFTQREKHSPVFMCICGSLAVVCLLIGESEDTIVAGALTLGAIAGTFFEARFARFQIRRELRSKLLRLALGALIAGGFYQLPKLLLGEGIGADALSASLVAFAGIGLCPWIFTKLHL